MFFIFSLLIANVVSSSPVDLFRESAAFLATMNEADPNIVNKMINMVDDLVADNQQDKANSENTAVNSRADADAKAQEFADRTSAFNSARQAFVTSTGVKNQLTTLEATHRAVLDAALNSRDDAQAHADKMAASLESISQRVATEKKAFAEVLELLSEVIVPENLLTLKRNLLSFDEANPDAVKAVQAQVEALVEAANAELKQATNLNDEAQKALDAAQKAYQTALDTHTDTSGKLAEAIKDLAKKKEAKDNAETAMKEAEKANIIAERKAVSDRTFANSEAARVAEEAKALAQAKTLLQSLL